MLKGMIFDLNGTVIDILTNESDSNVYRVTANFLSYCGVRITPERLGELYSQLNRQQRHESHEEFPEFDVQQIFHEIIERFKFHDIENIEQLAATSAMVFRAASRHRLQPYPEVFTVLSELKKHYRLAAVSDGQSNWAVPELQAAGLAEFFQPVLVSGDHGFRKPDKRFFAMALAAMDLSADEVIFVGNDMYRDIYGAHSMGMKTVFFKSNQGDHNYAGAHPDYIIYNFGELLKAVDFLQKTF